MRHGWTAAAAIVAMSVGFASVRKMTARGAAPHLRLAGDRATPIYRAGLARLDIALLSLDSSLASGDALRARRAFRHARAAYKRVELFAEYYAASRVRELNGVPMAKAEEEDPETPLAPVGLQMVEQILFPVAVPRRTGEARQLVRYMRDAVRSLRDAGADSMAGDAYVFDAMRQEVARVSTLGIAGFDATLSGDAMAEGAEALEGVRAALAPYRRDLAARAPERLAALDAALSAAIRSLRAQPDFESFDRLAFLAPRALPLAHALMKAQRALGIGPVPRPRAWSARAASPFDADAFDARFFAATDAPLADSGLIALGRDLFFEPALSGPGTRSCAACHQPARAFTDGRARPVLLPSHAGARPARSTPTLLNAGLQPTQFADGRVRTLEDQATDVMGSATEMGGSLAQAAARLRARGDYGARFARAFGSAPDTAVSARALRLAVAAYVRSLTSLRSPFDRAVRGDTLALDAEQRAGFNLFMGKGKCGTCHFAPLFGGAMPPALVENEPEVIGVPARLRRRGSRVDPDSGRFTVQRIDQHLHAFKTPTLRNVALTAPYMHNGVFLTLESVIDFYDAGGGSGLGIALPNQTLPPDSLHLSAREKRAMVRFLESLTDTSGTTASPVIPQARRACRDQRCDAPL